MKFDATVKVHITHNNHDYQADLTQPISIALGFGPLAENPNAFHINPAKFEPIRVGDFVGAVAEGGSANCEVVTYCAHGNGTHTECVGHLSSERIHVAEIHQTPNLLAQLITVPLHIDSEGRACVTATSFVGIEFETLPALIVRTTPNESDKKSRVWSGNEPPYFSIEAMQHIVDAGFEHLLTDLPSVDPEEDAGALAAHRIWWQYPQNTRLHATITELIFVPNFVSDGMFYLQLNLPKIHSDAVPSQPMIYPLSRDV